MLSVWHMTCTHGVPAGHPRVFPAAGQRTFPHPVLTHATRHGREIPPTIAAIRERRSRGVGAAVREIQVWHTHVIISRPAGPQPGGVGATGHQLRAPYIRSSFFALPFRILTRSSVDNGTSFIHSVPGAFSQYG